MKAKDLVSDVIPYLRSSDTGKKALTWMEIFRISHLPIVKHDEFVGIISDTDIYDLDIADEKIGNLQMSLQRHFVEEDAHIYEIINLAAVQQLTVIPVLADGKRFVGVITLHQLLQHVADTLAVKDAGGIIELETGMHDYSLSQIAQIVEGNGIKILSLYVSSPEDANKLRITLKLNSTDMDSIIRSFERYDYTIVDTYMQESKFADSDSEHFELFLKYMNI